MNQPPFREQRCQAFSQASRSSFIPSDLKNLSNILTISSLPRPLFPKITPHIPTLPNRNDGAIASLSHPSPPNISL
jgi:hypothetical protein